MYTLGVLNDLSLDANVEDSLAMEGDVAKDDEEASVGVSIVKLIMWGVRVIRSVACFLVEGCYCLPEEAINP